MTFFDSAAVILRQWKIVVPVLFLGLLGTLQVVRGIGTEYESIATVLFLPPSVEFVELEGETVEETFNPYFNAGVTRTLAQAVSIAVESTTIRQQAREAGVSPNYELQLDDFEPLLLISAKSSTPENSSDTLDFVLFRIDEEVVDRQGVDTLVPTTERASYDILNEVRAVADSSASIRVLGTMTVAVVLITVMAAFAAEGWSQRRRLRTMDPRDLIDGSVAPDGRVEVPTP